MDYEKKYNEAQKWIESIYSELSHEQQMEAEAFFPELKESEDERIRKEIIATIHLYYGEPLEDEAKEMIAWLGKQGDKKTTDKVESKFKVGDWIIRNNEYTGVPIQVIEFKGYYRCNLNGEVVTLTPNDVHNNFHLWTIQDAKDGDVLVCPLPKGCESGEQIFIFKGINSREYVDNCIEYYCRICEGVFYENENGYMGTTSSPLYPATKEQRDALFAKMKEAGYEWDAEKKELKEIEDEEYNGEDYGIDSLWHAKNILEETLGKVDGYQTDDGILEHKCAIAAVNKLYKQKPAWSEEDETKMRAALAFIKSEFPKNGDEEIMEGTIEWLKSLKERYTWKPSDEQMIALSEASGIVGMLTPRGMHLQSLYNDLKKLTE